MADEPRYHVVRVSLDVPDTLHIIARNVQAKSPEKATDLTVESLPIEERDGVFGAFPVRYFYENEYAVERIVRVRKGKRPRVGENGAKAKTGTPA